jgi:thiol-disulfide isomerase/thioredoxin
VVTERLVLLGVVAVGVTFLWLGLRWRTARLRRPNAGDVLARLAVSGSPLVMAFTTPECVPCRTIQRPALEELARRYPGRVHVREVDATVDLDLADRFGIMTVPSTVIIGPLGDVIAINYGAARWEKLAAQLGLGAALPAGRLGQAGDLPG